MQLVNKNKSSLLSLKREIPKVVKSIEVEGSTGVAGRMGNKELVLNADRVSVLQNQKKRVLQMDGGDGCTIR